MRKMEHQSVKPKTLPNTGDVVGYGYLVGAGVLAGLDVLSI